MDNENIKVEKNNKKVILSLGIVLSVFIVLIFSATYAYFSVNTTNNFGNTTIDATAESTGTVALNGTSASLRLDLSAADMMQGTGDITYWGTADGTPSTTQNIVTIGSTEVTGAGYFNCNYTLSVTATATNNMYTAFQGMTGKSEEQIVLKIGDTKYDFNTPNLFPITVNGTLNGLTSSSSKSLTAEFYLVNKEGVIQDALEYKDLSIAITATNFSCTAVDEPATPVYTYYGWFDENNEEIISNTLNGALPESKYYSLRSNVKPTFDSEEYWYTFETAGGEIPYVCGLINDFEICLNYNSADLEAQCTLAGGTFMDEGTTKSCLETSSNPYSTYCTITDSNSDCGTERKGMCTVSSDGFAQCSG